MSNIPTPPRPPSPTPSSRGQSCLALFLAFLLAVVSFTVVAFLSMGFAAVILGVISVVFGIIGIHYLTWGWWLPKVLPHSDDDDV